MRSERFIGSAVLFGAVLLFVSLFYGTARAQTADADTAILSKLQNDIFLLEEKIGALTGRQEELQYQLRRLREELQTITQEAGGGSQAASGENKALADRVRRLEEHNTAERLDNLLSENISARLEKLEQALAQGAVAQPKETAANAEETATAQAVDESAIIDIYQAAFSQLTKRQYDAAEASFKDFLAQYGNHPLAANAAYWLGESYYVRRDYKAAAEQFLQTYNNYADGVKRFDALLKLAFSLRALGGEAEACKVLAELLNPANDPNNRLTDNIRLRAEKERTDLQCQ